MGFLDTTNCSNCLEIIESLIEIIGNEAGKKQIKFKHIYERVESYENITHKVRILKKLFKLKQFSDEFYIFIVYVAENLQNLNIEEEDALFICHLLNVVIEICIDTDQGEILSNLISDLDMYMVFEKITQSSNNSLISFYIVNVLPKYLKLNSNYSYSDKQRSRLFDLIKKRNDIKLMCIAYDFLILSDTKSPSCLLKSDEYWNWLASNLVVGNTLQKHTLYVFKRSINIYTKDDSDRKLWTNYFTLLELSKEKQLHLIKPAMNLLNEIQPKIEWKWHKCLLELLLNHSQISVVHQAIINTLSNINNDNLHFELIVEQILIAFSHKYSTVNMKLLECMQLFISTLNTDKFTVWCEQSLNVNWNPSALWYFCKCTFKNTLVKNAIRLELFQKLLEHFNKVPNIFIRDNAMKLLSEFFLQTSDICSHDLLALLKTLFLFQPITFEKYTNHIQISSSVHDQLKPVILRSIIETNENTEEHKALVTIAVKLDLIEDVAKLPNSDLLIVKIYEKHKINSDILLKYVAEQCMSTQKIVNSYSIQLFRLLDFKLYENMYKEFINNSTNGDCSYRIALLLYLSGKFGNVNLFWEITKFHSFPSMELQAILIDTYSELGLKEKSELLKHSLDSNEDSENILCRVIDYASITKDNEILEEVLEKIQLIKNPATLRNCLIYFINKVYNKEIVNHNTDFIKLSNNLLMEYALVHDVVAQNFIEKIEELNLTTKEFLPILLKLLFLGIYIKKEERLIYSTYQDILLVNGYDDQNPNIVKDTVRFKALQIICKGIKWENISDLVVSKLLELYQKHYKKRYFPDSLIHIEKLRIWQNLLVIEPYLHASKTSVSRLIDFIFESFSEEIHQPCVKQLMQYLLIKLLAVWKDADAGDDAVLRKILKTLSAMTENHPAAVTAIMPIIYHWLLVSNKSELWKTALEILVPYAMGSNFKIRTYAQYTIMKMESKQQWIKSNEWFFKSIKQILHESGNNIVTVLKKDKEFFDYFDTSRHFTIETIFVDMPKLNQTPASEWENVLSIKFHADFHMSIKNTERSFSNCISLSADKEIDHALWIDTTNLQKKILPWKSIVEEQRLNSDFILIASLIDKPSNLGGLSRTCEVFGIKQLTLHSGSIPTNKEFKSLSMSSESWVNIIEVKQEDLSQFIFSLKGEGYKVIAAEQTSESTQLDVFKFPKKAALILGNEKEGVPANLLPLIDNCVEIPQLGVIRSLNVHVAGAMFIWEYTKQHILSSNLI